MLTLIIKKMEMLLKEDKFKMCMENLGYEDKI